MKRLLQKITPAFAFVLAVFFTSAAGQSQGGQTIIIDDSRHFAAYQVENKNVIFVLEMIDDFTDNTDDYFPRVDFVSLIVDVNQNAEIDKFIDTSYGLVGKKYVRPVGARPGICTQFMINDIGKTGCGLFRSRAALDYGFNTSDKEARQHPVYKFTIPKKELSQNGNSAQIRLSFYSSEKGFQIYPAKEPGEVYNSLAKTLTINF